MVIKVKYLTSCSGTAGNIPAGSVRELSEAKAIYLQSIGRVEILEFKVTPKNEVSDKQSTSNRTNKSKRGKRPSKN